MAKSRRVRVLPRAEAITDFRLGIDRVIREGSRCFVVSGQHEYAPVEVVSDVLTDEARRNMQALAPKHLPLALHTIQNTPYLSEEGRRERLAVLHRRPDVTFRFEVLAPLPDATV